MEPQIETLTIVEKNGTFRVAYDGQILGDDRGYPTKAACDSEIDRRIEKDRSDAARFARPVLYRKG